MEGAVVGRGPAGRPRVGRGWESDSLSLPPPLWLLCPPATRLGTPPFQLGERIPLSILKALNPSRCTPLWITKGLLGAPHIVQVQRKTRRSWREGLVHSRDP